MWNINTKLISLAETTFTLNDYLKLWRLSGSVLGAVNLRQPTILRTEAEIQSYPDMVNKIAEISIPTKETFLNILKFNDFFGSFSRDELEAIKTWSNIQIDKDSTRALFKDFIERVETSKLSIQKAVSSMYMIMLMAHEMGHHKWIPYDYKTSVLIIDSVYTITGTQDRAIHIANIYEDLVINNSLLKDKSLPMHMPYQKMTVKNEVVAPFWTIYMRTYEQLWLVKILSDAQRATISSIMENDAKAIAKIIQQSNARNYITQAKEVANIINKYYDDSTKLTPNLLGGDSSAVRRKTIAGKPILGKYSTKATKKATEGMSRKQEQETKSGTIRSLPEYQDLMQRMGIADNIGEATIDYYLDLARQYAVQFPSVPRHHGSEIMEGVADWDPSMDPLERLDMVLTIQSGIVIPGITTVQREWVEGQDIKETIEPPDLMLYVDASGSMPNPSEELSPLVLAATIAMESALNAGKQVRACSYETQANYSAMEGMSDNQSEIMKHLVHHKTKYSSTEFPFQDLVNIYHQYQNEPVHLVVVSDDDFLHNLKLSFNGKTGLQLLLETLASRNGGGTLFLSADIRQIIESFPGFDIQSYSLGNDLRKVHIPFFNLTVYPISILDDLALAAEDMAQATYNPYGYSEMLAP